MSRKGQELPVPLRGVRRRFERWRQSHTRGTRIPDSLWEAAAKMARSYGVNRTAKALGLDYYSLKERAEAPATQGDSSFREASADGVATFWELPPPPVSSASECVLELEDADGAKMRVHLKGVPAPDLAALSRSFWRVPR
jgi:hypothetical protein